MQASSALPSQDPGAPRPVPAGPVPAGPVSAGPVSANGLPQPPACGHSLVADASFHEMLPLRLVVAGAGGHAKEILELIQQQRMGQPVMYDEAPSSLARPPFCRLASHTNPPALRREFGNRGFPFVLAVGSPVSRARLYDRLVSVGGWPRSVIAGTAVVSGDAELSEGLNVMHFALISCDARIGRGSLVNARANLHHDTCVGQFCEICPGALILGAARLGDRVRVGSGAIVLPGIRVGDDVTIGAGAVVTRNVPDGVTVKGVPAR